MGSLLSCQKNKVCIQEKGCSMHHKPSGDPPTTYLNASLIKFSGVEQTFIATQAPKPNSFQNFWQMIIEKKVQINRILYKIEKEAPFF